MLPPSRATAICPPGFVDDTPRVFAGGYQPGNAGGNYYGEVTLREALSRSLNVATVDLAEAVGVSAMRTQLERFGIAPAERDADLALALGSMTDGVSPARPLRRLLRPRQRRATRGAAHSAQDRLQRRPRAL